MKSFGLLIIFKDGTKKVIHDVEDYGVLETGSVFNITTNKCNVFVPIDNVIYLGKRLIWENDYDY